jgi:Ca2+-dependent lipid-binding protein
MVGKIEFDLHDLILKGGKMESRTDKLAGEKDGSTMPGELFWEVGYFPKADFNKKLQTHGLDIRLPEEYVSVEIIADPDFVINLNSKTLKDSWIRRQKQILSIHRLTQLFLPVSSPSLSIRS